MSIHPSGFSLNRCGRQASRSPGMSRPRPALGGGPSHRLSPPSPLLYCELDWRRPLTADGHIVTWADTSSLRLAQPGSRAQTGGRGTGGAGLPPS